MSRTIHERILIRGYGSDDDLNGVPESYLEAMRGDGVAMMTLESAIDRLARKYNIESAPLFYLDEGAVTPGSTVETAKWKALVNPAWMSDGIDEVPVGKPDPVWHVVTDEYTPSGPDDLWDPLVDELRERDQTVFGEIRLTRFGGAQHIELFTPEETTEYGDSEHIMGVMTGNDYFGRKTQQAQIIALDLSATEEMRPIVLRDIVDPKKRKHTGSAPSEIEAWWSAVLDTIETVTDSLYEIVTDAMHYNVEIGELPCTVPEFYEELGLPNSSSVNVADQAAKNAVSTLGPDGFTAYHLHRSAMAAVDNQYAGRDTRAYTNHVATINELLFNPAGAEATVIDKLRSEVDEKMTTLIEDGSEAVPEDWDELETIESQLDDRVETITDGVDEFETARQKLRTMLEDAESDTEEAGA